MNHEVLRVLGNWTATSYGAEAVRVVSPRSFSGAAVWRVEAAEQAYALRQWQPQMHAISLRFIHFYQSQLARLGPPVIPVLQKTHHGKTIAEGGNSCFWELSTWRPGVADYWQNPSHQRLKSAMRVLAAIHNASAAEIFTDWPLSLEQIEGRDASAAARRGSPAIKRRARRLDEIVDEAWLKAALQAVSAASESERPLAAEAVSLIDRLAPGELEKALHWQSIDLPLRLRLGDVHHDHILFTGDEVTGVVDFGAADCDSPAGDVARLLGSLVGDDPEMRQLGIKAYLEVRALTPDEVAAVDFFDSSGIVAAAANWTAWLWGAREKRLPMAKNDAAIERLAWLVKRMRALAARTA